MVMVEAFGFPSSARKLLHCCSKEVTVECNTFKSWNSIVTLKPEPEFIALSAKRRDWSSSKLKVQWNEKDHFMCCKWKCANPGFVICWPEFMSIMNFLEICWDSQQVFCCFLSLVTREKTKWCVHGQTHPPIAFSSHFIKDGVWGNWFQGGLHLQSEHGQPGQLHPFGDFTSYGFFCVLFTVGSHNHLTSQQRPTAFTDKCHSCVITVSDWHWVPWQVLSARPAFETFRARLGSSVCCSRKYRFHSCSQNYMRSYPPDSETLAPPRFRAKTFKLRATLFIS